MLREMLVLWGVLLSSLLWSPAATADEKNLNFVGTYEVKQYTLGEDRPTATGTIRVSENKSRNFKDQSKNPKGVYNVEWKECNLSGAGISFDQSLSLAFPTDGFNGARNCMVITLKVSDGGLEGRWADSYGAAGKIVLTRKP